MLSPYYSFHQEHCQAPRVLGVWVDVSSACLVGAWHTGRRWVMTLSWSGVSPSFVSLGWVLRTLLVSDWAVRKGPTFSCVGLPMGGTCLYPSIWYAPLVCVFLFLGKESSSLSCSFPFLLPSTKIPTFYKFWHLCLCPLLQEYGSLSSSVPLFLFSSTSFVFFRSASSSSQQKKYHKKVSNSANKVGTGFE